MPPTPIQPMHDAAATRSLLRLVTWLSPAFPIGAFAYSGGLEQAVHDGRVRDAAGLQSWLNVSMGQGSLWNDAVLLAESHGAVGRQSGLAEVTAIAEALAGSRERHQETLLLGEAFLAAASAWPHPAPAGLGPAVAYPVAVGAVAGAHGVDPGDTIAAYLHASVSMAVSVAIRCGVLGQRDGTGVLAALEEPIATQASRALASTLDDLGSATVLAEISALRHETLHSRLFRS